MVTKIGEWKGRKTLSLLKDDKDERPFTFGVMKAKLILDNLPDIEKFVRENYVERSQRGKTEEEP